MEPDRLRTLDRVIRSRRMVRAFTDEVIDPDLVDQLLDLTRRSPSAGNTQPWELLALTGDDVQAYWDLTLGARRSSFRWQGMLRAPLLVLVYVRPESYVERYQEPDKAHTGLGDGLGAWPVPYWWVDAGAAVENLLLAVAAAGLGACVVGQFDHEGAVRDGFGVPDDRRCAATVAIGHPDVDEAGRSASRSRRPLDEVVHRGRW